MSLAPIVLFVYNRPEHTRMTLEALSANILADQSELFVYCDGPKVDASNDDIIKIENVRKVVRDKKWCSLVNIIEANTNKGLAASVIHGVTEIVNRYGKVIVLEDDLITSPYFLQYMNEGLALYENSSNIYSVNGYMFPISWEVNEVVLLPYTSTWGWGTWKEKWSCFNFNSKAKLSIDENTFLRQRFNLANYDYTTMLMNAKDSWGIHWYLSVFERNGLGIFPTLSLVQNIGFDGTGVHFTQKIDNLQYLSKKQIFIKNINVIDLKFYSKYLSYFGNSNNKSKKHLVFKLKKFIKRNLINEY